MTELEQIAKAVEIVVATFRKIGRPDAEIRESVRAALREAFAPTRELFREAVVDGQSDWLVSAPGMFRIVSTEHGADLTDPYVQERYAAQVTRALDRLLGGLNSWIG